MTKEYLEAERQKQLKLARKFARELSAREVNPEVGEDNIQDKTNDVNDGRKDGEEGNDVKDYNGEDNDKDYREAPLNVSAEEVFFTKQTRLSSSVSKEQDPIKLMVLVSKWTQTEVLGLDSIKKFPAISTRLNLNGRACHPSYLQSGLLMMASTTNPQTSLSWICTFIILLHTTNHDCFLFVSARTTKNSSMY